MTGATNILSLPSLPVALEQNRPDILIACYTRSLLEQKPDEAALLKLRLNELLCMEDVATKRLILWKIEQEIAVLITNMENRRFWKIRRRLLTGTVTRLNDTIWSLRQLRLVNPFVNSGFVYRKAVGIWLQALLVLLGVAAMEFTVTSFWNPQPLPLLPGTFMSQHAFRVWIFGMISAMLGAWLPFSKMLGSDAPELLEEYTLRSRITLVFATGAVLSTLVLTFLYALNPAVFSGLIAPGKRDLFNVAMCGLIGAGDMFVWSIVWRALSFPRSGSDRSHTH